MSLGGEIKVVLTLDDSGFSVKTKKAAEVADQLQKTFGKTAESSQTAEKSIDALTKAFDQSAKNLKAMERVFGALNRNVEAVANKLDRASTSFVEAGRASSTFGAVTEKAVKSMEEGARASDLYVRTMRNIAPELRQNAKLQEELTNVGTKWAQRTAAAYDQSAAVQLRAIRAEKQRNSEIIADRQRTVDKLVALEKELVAKQEAADSQAKRYFGRNASKAIPFKEDSKQYATEVTAVRAEIDAVKGVTAALTERNAVLDAGIQKIKDEQSAILKQKQIDKDAADAKKKADKDAADAKKKADKEAAAAKKAADKEAADAERSAAATRVAIAKRAADDAAKAAVMANRQAMRDIVTQNELAAREVANMWKGMGALWASAKVDKAIGSAIHNSAEYQTVGMRVDSLNLPANQLAEFNQKAWDLPRQEKYLSNIDAMQLRLDALTASGINDAKEIDKTLASATRAGYVLKSLGYEQGSMSDIVKNMYGIGEARQLMNDPEAFKKSVDTTSRIVRASGGKLNVADIESVLRSLGSFRNTLSDEGLINLAALAEQQKVAGSSGNSGGQGVQTAGTAVKMMGLYMSGKSLSDRAVKIFGEAGLLDMTALDSMGGAAALEGGGSKQAIRALKNAGFVGKEQFMQDPVGYLAGPFRDALIAYTQRDDKRKQYYGDKTNDQITEKDRQNATLKLASQTGMSNKAVEQMTTATNAAFIARTSNVAKLAKNSKSDDELVDDLGKTWNGSIIEMKAGLVSLAASFAPVLEKLAIFPKAIGEGARAMGDFFKGNDIASMATVAAAAIGALTLKASALKMLFGTSFGTVISASFRPLLSIMTALLKPFSLVSKAVIDLVASFASLTPLGATVGSFGTAVGVVFETLGRTLLRLIPYVGWFIAAWDLAGLLLNLEVGGKKISDWIVGWLDDIKNWFVVKWNEIKALVLETIVSLIDGSAWENFKTAIGSIVDSVWEYIKGLGASVVNWVGAKIDAGINLIKSLFNTGVDWIKSRIAAVPQLLTNFIEWVTGWAKKIRDFFSRAFEPDTDILAEAKNIVVNFGNNIANFMRDTAKSIGNWFRDVFDEIRTGAIRAANEARAAAAAAKNAKNDKKVTQKEGVNDNFWGSFLHVSKHEASKSKGGSKDDSEGGLGSGFGADTHPIKNIGGGGGGGGRKRGGGGHKAGREFEDPFAVKFAQYEGRGEIDKLKIDAVLGDDATFDEQAKAEVMKMWLGGELDVGKDPRKRMFVKAGVKYDKERGYSPDDMDWSATRNVNGKQQSLEDLQKVIAKQLEMKTVLKGVAFAKERDNALSNEASNALKELTDQSSGSTDAMKALTREFERMEGRTPGLKGNADYAREKAKALAARAVLDYTNEGIALKKKNLDLEAELDDDQLHAKQVKAKAEYDEAIETQNAIVEAHRKAVADMEAAGLQGTKQYEEALEAQAIASDRFAKHQQLRLQKLTHDMRSPAEELANQWKHSYSELDQLGANWSKSFMDNLNTALSGGQADWKSFLRSIVVDFQRIILQSLIGDEIAGIGNKVAGGLKSALKSVFGKKDDGVVASAAVTDAASVGVQSVASSFSLAGGFSDNQQKNPVTDAATSAASALLSVANSSTDATGGIGNMVSSVAENVAVTGQKIASETSSTMSLDALSIAAQDAAASLYQIAATSGSGGSSGIFGSALSIFGFANGGIMSEFGSVPLRKYANGGVADSPQLALFGEGSMREAYVPLPDGRSIPVTMNGDRNSGNVDVSGGNVVTISITVNGSNGNDSVDASGIDPNNAYKNLANKVKSLVKEELVNQRRAGNMLAK